MTDYEAISRLKEEGYRVWNRLGYVVLSLSSEVRKRIGDFHTRGPRKWRSRCSPKPFRDSCPRCGMLQRRHADRSLSRADR